MKKIIGVLAAAAMAFTLFTGCAATAPKTKPDLSFVQETHRLEVVNDTKNFVIEVACIAKIKNGRPQDGCLFDPIVLFPPHMVDDDFRNVVMLDVPTGQYALLVVSYDLRTQEHSASVMVSPLIDQDARLVFKEEAMNVGGATDA